MKTATFLFFVLFLTALFFSELLILKIALFIIFSILYLVKRKNNELFIEGEMIRIRAVPYYLNLLTSQDCFNSEKIFINEYFLDIKINEKVVIVKINYDLMKKIKLEKSKTENTFIVTVLCKKGIKNELIALF